MGFVGNVGSTPIKDLDKSENINKSDYNGSTYHTIVYKDTKAGPITIRLHGDLEIYNYNNNRQINKITSTYWSPISSGNYTLESSYSNGYLDNTPGKRATIYGTTNIDVVTQREGEFSIPILKNAGFTISADDHGRKDVNFSFNYSLY